MLPSPLERVARSAGSGLGKAGRPEVALLYSIAAVNPLEKEYPYYADSYRTN